MNETITTEYQTEHTHDFVLAHRLGDLLEASARSLIVLSQHIGFGSIPNSEPLTASLSEVEVAVEDIINHYQKSLSDEEVWGLLTPLEDAVGQLVTECHNLGINGKPDEQDAVGLVVAHLSYYMKKIKGS